ncbi:aminodeoxychorismate/anthranilate synthase component II [Cellulomonas sp. zg-ZUI222]|uniref:Aminodeoxychorismate/anthranilate synthase component II n=1 Tax=Cellulomonas wangleii TaxID=2816956 RepID=A0ABX8D7E7_9CELL|nr:MULTISPECIES: aminodeoxychorismate/anthranilate synthase component II [Cellulomonas]MBO0898583.1 aminodeoxychorismate/anthranilate synthase component II [Cellulomonas sp. zg-ZUI22]MBO0919445.1 aminodeoxychorismate/anthranilate synthase component II [Cellulomonas wangleii]MBO0924415.1 aminodeoxychorismate/anthranilate synthase component II [Cellulomonas wangleii]QVI62411.1 aminodeoxychorismate/anthranilate synthase component II [Cellulomonas wangleii]
MTRILVVDNYDSFVYTIVGYLDQLGAKPEVVRNDAVPPAAERAGYDGVLVSPGPGAPADAGASTQVIRDCATSGTPMLGVCLGHQALGEVFGGTVTHAPELMHGKTSQVEHDGQGVLAGLPVPFTATRYHSLAVVDGTFSDELVVTARANGIIMGLQHRDLPLHGVQFHPESVLTEGGHRLLANWLEVCGARDAVERSQGLHPLVRL